MNDARLARLHAQGKTLVLYYMDRDDRDRLRHTIVELPPEENKWLFRCHPQSGIVAGNMLREMKRPDVVII